MLAKLFSFTLAAFFVSACATSTKLPEIEGYQMLTVPSNNYEVGDFIAVFTNPPKEDVLFATSIDSSNIRRSDGPDFTNITNTEVTADIEGRLAKRLEADAGTEITRIKDIQYTNTKIESVEISSVSQQIIDQVNAEPGTKSDILFRTRRTCSFGFLFCGPLTRTEILTDTLSADVVYTFETDNQAEAEASAERLALAIGGSVDANTSSEIKVTAMNLVVGFRTDPIGAQRVIRVLRESSE